MAGMILGKRLGGFAGVLGFAAIASLCTGGAVWYLRNQQGDSSNYRLESKNPVGWTAVPHGPQTLFLYRDPTTGILLRGAHNQIVAEFNPTPGDSKESVAQYYIDRTNDNLKEWTAKMSESVNAKGGSFQLIDREKKGKRVVTAFGVRGNSTFIVSISANGKEVGKIDGKLPWFKQFLSEVEFQPFDYNLVASR
jgi:hypothetical protein